MTTPCPSTSDLHGLVNGSLSDSEADSLQLHIESCESCQNALQEMAADGDFWKSAVQSLSDNEAAGPALERVVDELQHQSPEDAEAMGEAIELKLSFIEHPTEPGTIGRLKHYDILRVAGRGGMGIVLKAFDRTLRRVVAVKMLAPHLAGNGQARQRFVREGRSAAAICHEHVVTIHAVEESPPFIVMQYVKGETLEARIHRNGSLEVREAVRIAKQIAQGLAAAHTQGVVHRDIKPANILLENGVARVRITDFGLARAVDDASLTQSGVVAGTPQYMAPEQANGDAVDERADLFSLGSVLYTMLAGHAPFRATTTMGVLKRLCDHNARPIREINPDVPDWLVVLINRLHAKRPADRYQSTQEVADVLERGLAAMQNGAAPTVEIPKTESTTDALPEHSQVSSTGSLKPAASLYQKFATSQQLMLRWLMLSVPVWLITVALFVALCGMPGGSTAEISVMLFLGTNVLGLLIAGLKPFWSEPETSDDMEAAAHTPDAVDFKRLVPRWMFRPLPLWMVFVVVGLCVTPFSPSAAVLAAILAAAWLVIRGRLKGRKKGRMEEGGNSQTATGTASEMVLDNFVLIRLLRSAVEVAPRSFGSCLVWLFAWLAPAFVWATVFFIQEDRIRMTGTSWGIDEIDWELLLVAYGVCALWLLIGSLWFKRRQADGTAIFARGARWTGVLGTLGLASIFVVCGYETWKSDVYLQALSVRSPRDVAIILEAPRASAIAQHSMLRVEFEVAVDDLEVVIDFDDDDVVKLSPDHHGIIVQLTQPAGTYEWRAIHKGQHVASGQVTLSAGQLAEIKVPRPKLIQLIAGRWESDPKTNGFSEMALDGGAEDSDIQYEFEFEKDLATFAMRESGQVDRSQFHVRIDESVAPALIDLTMPDGQQLTGIVKFQPGRRSRSRTHDSDMTSMMGSGGAGMSMESGTFEEGSSGFASPGGGSAFGSDGFPGAASSEPDRLLICVTDGSGLRPWEFQADDTRGHMLFALVRSRESGSLREKLAFEPIKLETSPDLIMESVQVWSKRLKIESAGTNSIGIEMVLVPPAAYHLVDQPHLAALRREIPEPELIRDAIEHDPAFKYVFPAKLKQQISKTSKSTSYPFVVSRNLVTIDQFQQFVDETGYVTDAESDRESAETSGISIKGGWIRQGRLFNWAAGLDWQSEKSPDEKTSNNPVSVVSWRDATEFCKWLSEKEGRQYRLPKNEEWTAAIQLGAARKQLPSTNSDEPMLNDYYGWFDAKSQHPLGIDRSSDTYAEWTQDAQFGSKPDQMVLVHHEVSTDGVRFYSGTQFTADKSFRASDVGFRVVAELQALAEKSEAESSALVQ